MSTAALPFEIPRPVAKTVSRLRRLVRLYSLAEGVAALVIVAGVAFWIGLAVDWLLEPRPEIRMALWAFVGVAALVALWRYIVRRVFASLPDDSLALLVERQHPELGEGLVTTVQASAQSRVASRRRRSENSPHEQGFARELMLVTGRQTAAAMPQVELRRVFNMRPLVRKACGAAVLMLSVIGFAVTQREAYAFWLERMQLSEALWPRRVELTVVGFAHQDPAPVNVARDDAFDLEVLASIVDGHEAPDEVEIRWRRRSDGVRGGGPMLRIGNARPGRDEAQRYRYTLKVNADYEFDVIGGDDRVRNLRLHAVERPVVTRVWLETEYPAYLDRQPRSIPVSGRAELPEGARSVCRVASNKPLASVVVRDASEGTDLPADISKQSPNEFRFAIEPLAADRAFLITMHDQDGVENRDPFRLPISVVPDQPPEVSVQLRGIGTAITPQARLPLAGRVTDDYALVESWFEFQIDESAVERRPLRTQPDGMLELRMTEAFDLSEADPDTSQPRVPLKPGQKFVLALKARDAYDLGESPHVGASQRFLLDVVTASELRALLEKRELGLRRRFEAIHEKMASVHDLLGRIDIAAKSPGADDTASEGAAATEGTLERDALRVSGARQSATQLAFETGGVAEGFDDIVAELINNRVDTEELKERLEQGIAEPLKHIGGEMLPLLEKRLESVQAALEGAPGAATEPLIAAVAESEAVLEAMQAVLDRMLELESYNELVELLRGIVSDQEQLKQKTQEEQRAKLRGLLEE